MLSLWGTKPRRGFTVREMPHATLVDGKFDCGILKVVILYFLFMTNLFDPFHLCIVTTAKYPCRPMTTGTDSA